MIFGTAVLQNSAVSGVPKLIIDQVGKGLSLMPLFVKP